MAHAHLLRIVLSLLATSALVCAQDSPDTSDPETIRKDVNEVNLSLTVTDGRGRFVTGLTQQNFSILDDRRPPASVHRFQTLTDLPLRLCVVIDSSDSISHYVKFQQEVAIEFLKRVIRPGTDQACVVKFASKAVVMQEFTDDFGKLEAGVRAVKSDGATAVWDAVAFTSDLLAHAGSSDQVRRVIVLISDGDDNDSAMNLREATEAALRNEVAVEAVNTYNAVDSPRLTKLSSETGGFCWSGGNPKKIASALAKIEQSLRSGYFVVYEPAGTMAPGRFRRIQVKTRGARGRVAYRKGYFVRKIAGAIAAAGTAPE